MSAIARIFSRARMHEERGWLMMEIMVGAVALIITGLAIYQGLDRASTTSGQNRNRSVSAALAQQDQERLRSLDTSVLIGYIRAPYANTINVGGNNYNVTSNVAWANDSNGTATSCTSTSTLATYLKISSTVVDTTGKNKPVTIDSIMSPRADQGGASVQIVNRNGTTGVSGVPVALDQDASKNDTTDSNGCAQFGFLKGTAYTVSFSQSGYVNTDGDNAINNQPITVVTGSSSVTQFMYDQAGAFAVTFTDQSGNTSVAGSTVKGYGVSVFHSKLPAPTTRTIDFGSTAVASQTSSKIWFPFFNVATNLPDPYQVWSGTCTAAKPTTPTTASLGPGQTLAVNVPMPIMTVLVQKDTINGTGGVSNYGAGAKVTVTDACGDSYTGTTQTDSKAYVPLPFGSLTNICAYNPSNTGQSSNTPFGTATNTSSGVTASTLTIRAWSGVTNTHCPGT